MNADDGTFSRADFIFDPVQNQFTCSAGKPLMQVSSQLHGPRSDKCRRRKSEISGQQTRLPTL